MGRGLGGSNLDSENWGICLMKKALSLELCKTCEEQYRELKAAGTALTDGSFCLACTGKIVGQAKSVVKGFSGDQFKSVLAGLKPD